jgi:hypothetical protein
MKWILIAAAALVALAAVVAIIGAMLPREHRASSSIVLHQPIDTVWTVVRNLAGATAWWPGMTVSERVADVNGKERWHQKGSGFDMMLEVTESSAPTRFVTLIVAAPGAAFGGTWTRELAAVDGGTRLTVTEDGWVANVIFRFVSRFIMGHHSTMDGFLGALGKQFGETVQPVHGP